MGISIWQLLILLAVVILIFGTKKLKNVGGDLGSAIKSFKSAVKAVDVEGKGRWYRVYLGNFASRAAAAVSPAADSSR